MKLSCLNHNTNGINKWSFKSLRYALMKTWEEKFTTTPKKKQTVQPLSTQFCCWQSADHTSECTIYAFSCLHFISVLIKFNHYSALLGSLIKSSSICLACWWLMGSVVLKLISYIYNTVKMLRKELHKNYERRNISYNPSSSHWESVISCLKCLQ